MISDPSKSVIFEKIYFLHASLSLPSSIRPLSLNTTYRGDQLSSLNKYSLRACCVPHTAWALGVIREQIKDPWPLGADLLAAGDKTMSNDNKNKTRSKQCSLLKDATYCGNRKEWNGMQGIRKADAWGRQVRQGHGRSRWASLRS